MGKVSCAKSGCANVMCLTDEVEARLRETHESFYCPMGHNNYFPAKTRAEKRIEELEREVGRLNRRIGWEREQAERMVQAAGMCPWPGCEFATEHVTFRFDSFDLSALRTHMRAAHGMPTLAAVEAKAS